MLVIVTWLRLAAAGLLMIAWGCKLEKASGPADQGSSSDYRISTWNLEYFNDHHQRGFPEYFFGGPLYEPRTDEDYAAIADVIGRQLDLAIIVMQEVNAEQGTRSAWGGPMSIELDRLLDYLGSEYAYAVTESGHPQHVAIVWDTTRTRVDTVFEIHYPEMLVDGQDVFLRDPLVAKFTLLSGEAAPELVIVGLHLASGKSYTRNHDSAFVLVLDTLSSLVSAPTGMLAGMHNLIIAGDLNFDFFDADRETFVEQMELGAWDVLADWDYRRTRLGGVPLAPESRLDYLICTDAMRQPAGLIDQPAASVHADLAGDGYDSFRRVFSDHLPVSVVLRPPSPES